MSEKGFKCIIVFLLEFLINIILLNTLLLRVPLGWQILILVIIDSFGWWMADQIDW